MSIKKKMQFNRSDFTYESEDGDSYSITYIDSGDREYFEVTKIGSTDEKKVYDVKMWQEILSERDAIKQPPAIIKVDRSNLQRPRISDLRNNSPDSIQDNVDQSMAKVDSDVPPVESFSPVSETPADWKINEGENTLSWKDQVKFRQENIPRPTVIRNYGSEGAGFKRVDADDLI